MSTNDNVIYVTDGDFEDHCNKEVVLVDFFANWCGPCKMFDSVLQSLAKEKPDIPILKVNVDECVKLSERFSITSLPTIVLIKNGEEVKRKVGSVNLSLLKEFISD